MKNINLDSHSIQREQGYKKPHYNTVIYAGYIDILIQTFGVKKAKGLLSNLPLPYEYISRPNNWVSEDFSELFFDYIFSLEGVPEDISFQAGAWSLTNSSMAYIYILRLLSLEKILTHGISIIQKYTKVDKVSTEKKGGKTARVKFVSNRKTDHLGEIVQNWLGFIHSTTVIHPEMKLETSVSKQGSSSFELEIKWSESESSENILQLVFGSILGACAVIVFGALGKTAGLVYVSFFGIYLLHSASRKIKKDSLLKNKKWEYDSQDALKSVQNQLNISDLGLNKNRLAATMSSINTLSSRQTETEIISSALDIVVKQFGYKRAIYLKKHSTGNYLCFEESSGVPLEQSKVLSGYRLSLDEVTNDGRHIGNVYKTGISQTVEVDGEFYDGLSPKGRQLVRHMRSTAYAVTRVGTDGVGFGLIIVDYDEKGITISQEDLETLESISIQIAICLQKRIAFKTEESIRKSFQKFVPKRIIKDLISDVKRPSQKREVTMIFTDVNKFTKMSRLYQPGLFAKAVNIYLSRLADIIISNGGVVDKFIGDAVFAHFNSVSDDENHANAAIIAALQIVQEEKNINSEIAAVLQGTEWAGFSTRVGVNTGESIVGFIGTEQRMEFTVIGEEVNKCAKLCDYCKVTGDRILISNSTYAKLSNSKGFKELNSFEVPGFDSSDKIFGYR